MDGKKKIKPFAQTLMDHGLKLTRGEILNTLQVNTGLLCDQRCSHCHLSAGPGRKELMDWDTAESVIEFAGKNSFQTIDITGGAPELNPVLPDFIKQIHPLAPKIILRSNLTALNDGRHDHLMGLLQSCGIAIVASFPSTNESQTRSQRGEKTFQKSIETLKKLNMLGFGCKDSGLELDLVSNPTGAFLPPSQVQAEKRFHRVLMQKWGIEFNNLYIFANVPLGRFKTWLVKSENYQKYMEKIASNFNPCSVDGLMCRSQMSVSWDGFLYDCDFNLAAGLSMGGKKIHISEINSPPVSGAPISVADFCYTCTAGSGFT